MLKYMGEVFEIFSKPPSYARCVESGGLRSRDYFMKPKAARSVPPRVDRGLHQRFHTYCTSLSALP